MSQVTVSEQSQVVVVVLISQVKKEGGGQMNSFLLP